MAEKQLSILDAPRMGPSPSSDPATPGHLPPQAGEGYSGGRLSEGRSEAEPTAPFLFVKSVEILPGDEMDTAVFGKVRIDCLFDTEAEARAAGYVMDTHMKGGAWPFAGWKILANVDRGYYAAVRLEVENGQGADAGGDPENLRESGGVDRNE